jgi:hydroxyacylglutathione hydrolase
VEPVPATHHAEVSVGIVSDAVVAPPEPRIIILQLGAIGTNCYIVHAAGRNDAVIIDPGADADVVVTALAERNLEPVAICISHRHWDHVGAVADLAERFTLPVYMSAQEADALQQLDTTAPPEFGPWRNWTVDHPLQGTERLELAGLEFEVMEVPGHSQHHLAYLVAGSAPSGDTEAVPPLLFSGDVLFAGSIGRTDLPGADHDTLMRTLARLLTVLDDSTIVLSGHGAPTTIGQERLHNPFLAGI